MSCLLKLLNNLYNFYIYVFTSVKNSPHLKNCCIIIVCPCVICVGTCVPQCTLEVRGQVCKCVELVLSFLLYVGSGVKLRYAWMESVFTHWAISLTSSPLFLRWGRAYYVALTNPSLKTSCLILLNLRLEACITTLNWRSLHKKTKHAGLFFY